MDFDEETILYWGEIGGIAVLLAMCILCCLKCRHRKRSVVTRTLPTVSSNVYSVPTTYNAVGNNPAPQAQIHNINRGHNRISSQGDRFAVPLDLLPPNFDFNSPGVVHKGDHVLVKDLRIIQFPSNDEYQKQAPYNPNFR